MHQVSILKKKINKLIKNIDNHQFDKANREGKEISEILNGINEQREVGKGSDELNISFSEWIHILDSRNKMSVKLRNILYRIKHDQPLYSVINLDLLKEHSCGSRTVEEFEYLRDQTRNGNFKDILSMTKLGKFIVKQSKENTPVGDLAKAILLDSAIPINPQENELFPYLERKPFGKVSLDAFQEFKKEYYSNSH
jgi:hypothetical protein